ncbi:MAG: hypothetical protein GTO14_06175 [Anaerolineales bacterium]|nr:hypothetical protein [Anaerolineales bacterium]
MSITDVDALLEAISQVNLDFIPLPLAIALHVVAFMVLMLLFFLPNRYAREVNALVKAWLAISLGMVTAFILGVARAFSGMDVAILSFGAVVYAGVAVLVLADIWRRNLDFTSERTGLRQWMGLAVALCGILLYSLTQLSMGLRYPRMVFYGAEVPTAIYLIALFGAARPIKSKLFRVILAILSVEATLIGIWAVAAQVWFDAYMGLAGLFGLASLASWIAAERKQAKASAAHMSQ